MTEAVAKTPQETGAYVAKSEEEIMTAWMAQIICVMIRGILSCFPTKRVETVLILASAVMGQQLGALYGGDELSVFKFRKACRENFSKTITDAPVHKLEEAQRADTASIGTVG